MPNENIFGDGPVTREKVADALRELVSKEAAEIKSEVETMVKEEMSKGKTLDAAGQVIRNYTPGTAGGDANRFDGNKEFKKVSGMAKAARFLRALAAGRNDIERGARHAEKWGDAALAKDLRESVFAQGGALVPEPLMDEVIENLKSTSVVRALGARVLPMPNGQMNIARVATGTTGAWTAESTGPNATTMTFEHVTLNAKKMMAIVPISKDLLEDGDILADQIVAEDLRDELARAEDIAYIRADGTGNQPKGILQLVLDNVPAHAFQITHAGATATQKEIVDDLCKAMRLSKSANVRRRNPGWMMTARSEHHLLCLLDDNNNFIFREEIAAGRLFGFPLATTEEIPENLDVSGSLANDETEVYFVDFGHVIIGESRGLAIEMMDGVAYKDAGGTVVSGFTNDEVVAKATLRTDIALRHLGREAAVIRAVDWGA